MSKSESEQYTKESDRINQHQIQSVGKLCEKESFEFFFKSIHHLWGPEVMFLVLLVSFGCLINTKHIIYGILTPLLVVLCLQGAT